MEHDRGERQGGDELEVQQQGPGRRGDPSQPSDEEGGAERTAEHHHDCKGRQPARSRRASGRRRTTDGSTAPAAPRYRRPASTSVGISPASCDAAGAAAPNNTAATRQRRTPRRCPNPADVISTTPTTWLRAGHGQRVRCHEEPPCTRSRWRLKLLLPLGRACFRGVAATPRPAGCRSAANGRSTPADTRCGGRGSRAVPGGGEGLRSTMR